MKINLNTLARDVAMREGKKKQVDIAQIKEVIKITFTLLSEHRADRILESIFRAAKK